MIRFRFLLPSITHNRMKPIMQNWRESSSFAALVLGVCLMGAAAIAAYAFYSVHTLDNTLTVTGSATQSATADSARWVVDVTRSATESTIPDAQVQVAADSAQVAQFFARAGIAASSTDVSAIAVDRDYGGSQDAPPSYNVHESVTVTSDDPPRIQALSKDITSLSNRGILFSAHQPEYYISNLPELRISLIGAAVQDAKKRAEQIAQSTGRAVGPLQSASGGVVQVMAPNSVDVSDYGSYDTSTIEKTVMVSTHATFYLR